MDNWELTEYANYPTKYNLLRKIYSLYSFAFLLWWKEEEKEEEEEKKNPETQRAVTLIGHSSQCLPSQNSDNTGKTIQWSKAVMRFFSSINRHDLAKWKKMV